MPKLRAQIDTISRTSLRMIDGDTFLREDRKRHFGRENIEVN